MSTGEAILLVLCTVVTIGNTIWFFGNLRQMRCANKLVQATIERYEQVSLMAEEDLRCEVCDECKRIVWKYQFENGKAICAGCMARALKSST